MSKLRKFLTRLLLVSAPAALMVLETAAMRVP